MAESDVGTIHAVHVTPWFSRKGGGVSAAVWGYVGRAAGAGWRATAAGVRDANLERDTAGRGAPVVAGRLVGPASLAYSPGLGRRLAEVDGVDVVHVHGLRHWPGYVAGRVAREKGVPLVVSPHGGLYPQVLRVGRARKWVTRPLDLANLRSAAVIHATSGPEARFVRAYGVRAPIAVVGLGIDSEVYCPGEATGRRGDGATKGEGARAELVARWPELAGKRILLHLGFLHAKKRIERLIWGLAQLGAAAEGWKLVVAGPDDGPDGARVRAAVGPGMAGRVTFTGAVWDVPTKLALLRAADVLAMPSDWENFGIAIGEALACGTPVIASMTAPWGAVVERECGWWVDVGLEPLTAALADVVAKSREELAAMGRRGRELIVERYAWADRARELGDVYRWACGKGTRPSFIYLDGATIGE